MFLNEKKVSILLSSYNGEKYLSEQIDSIINQSSTDWHLYIRDDGSTDKTREIIKNYCNQNPKITFINQNLIINKGVIGSFIDLLFNVKSEYYMFCDQDDVWLPSKVEKMLHLIEQENQDIPILGHSDLTIVDSDLKIISDSMMNKQKLSKRATLNNLIVQNNVTGCTTILNKKLRDISIKDHYNEKILMHDWWLALISKSMGKIVFLNEPTILYRQHENNVVGAKSIFAKINEGYALKKIYTTLENTEKQAEYFLKLHKNDLEENEIELLINYINLYNTDGISKIKILKKNNFKKTGFLRNIVFKVLILFKRRQRDV